MTKEQLFKNYGLSSSLEQVKDGWYDLDKVWKELNVGKLCDPRELCPQISVHHYLGADIDYEGGEDEGNGYRFDRVLATSRGLMAYLLWAQPFALDDILDSLGFD